MDGRADRGGNPRIPPSPAPLAPYGPGPSSFSMRIECSSRGMFIVVGRPVVERAEIPTRPRSSRINSSISE
jgi:hypothetical protein